ncbi:hypothetical protein GUJ93_ZPchr0025g2904 [Zizania palustris]|uniref:Uncharacterized protein n=1 Tax=Zizania palustris TaxID=103762 RepID=A0A8J5RA43_ZIZPA|nr:hypothetical protein GUJ93_ZPchr0025g2904 [Zizania palustris]
MGGDVRLDGDDTGVRSGVGEGGWMRRDSARASTGGWRLMPAMDWRSVRCSMYGGMASAYRRVREWRSVNGEGMGV